MTTQNPETAQILFDLSREFARKAEQERKSILKAWWPFGEAIKLAKERLSLYSSVAQQLAEESAKRDIPVGAVMPDGTVYAGRTEQGRQLFTTPRDAPLRDTFRNAADYAHGLEAHGHFDWRMPNMEELELLYRNRAAIGGFREEGVYRRSSYHSSTLNDNLRETCALNFQSGRIEKLGAEAYAPLRCVRI